MAPLRCLPFVISITSQIKTALQRRLLKKELGKIKLNLQLFLSSDEMKKTNKNLLEENRIQ